MAQLGPVEFLVGAAGVGLLVAAVANESPMGIVRDVFTGTGRRPISTASVLPRAAAAAGGLDNALPGSPVAGVESDYRGAPVNTGPGSTQRGSGLISSPRAKRIWDGIEEPRLAAIPWQPNLRMDYEAVASLVRVYADYGKPIYATGTYRTEAQQAAGHAQDPSRFAAKSAHTRGLAIDLDMIRMDVNDKRLVDAMVRHGWFRAGRSGPMHWSYGVPA